MKINDLLNEQEQLDELQPGQVPAWYDPRGLYGQGKQARQITKQDKQTASNLYKAWYGYAVRLEQALQGNPDPGPTRVQYFKSFLAKALRIPANSSVISEIDTIVDPSGSNYNKASVQKAIGMAVQKRALAMLSPTAPGTPPAGSGNPPAGSGNPPAGSGTPPAARTRPKRPTVGSTVRYAGKKYVWTNNAWRRGTEVLSGTDAKAATATFRKTP